MKKEKQISRMSVLLVLLVCVAVMYACVETREKTYHLFHFQRETERVQRK